VLELFDFLITVFTGTRNDETNDRVRRVRIQKKTNELSLVLGN